MKKIALLLMLLISAAAHGETRYGDLLRDSMYWDYMGRYVKHNYTLEGSKMANGKTYGLLNLYTSGIDGARGMEASTFDYWSVTIGIRDEGGRIYVNLEDYLGLFTSEPRAWHKMADGDSLPYETTEDGELVLYDFNKKVGDVYCQTADGTTLTVTKTDVMKTEDGVTRRLLTLSNGFELIEGVGCTNSPGMMLFWLNTKSDYRDIGVFTNFGMLRANNTRTAILAQDYDATVNLRNGITNKMLTQGRRWVYGYDNGQMKGTLTYYIDGDTLLHAFRRAKLYMTLVDNKTDKVVRSEYVGAFHESYKNIIYQAPGSYEDISLYYFDFGQQIGVIDQNGIRRRVLKTDDIVVNDNIYHRLMLLNYVGRDLPLDKDSLYYWVEGIGSSKGLLEHWGSVPSDSIQFVGCYDGGTCVFTNDDFYIDSGQPIQYDSYLYKESFCYYVDFSTKTASVCVSENYKSMRGIVIQPSVEFWGINCVVDKIWYSAFKDLTNLESIVIPESVREIGDEAFYGCTGLRSITIPEGVREIGQNAFRSCNGLTSISLPSSLISIGAGCFFGCNGLTSIILPEGLTSIGKWAFQSCRNLKEVDIPASVTSIDDYAFTWCDKLENVYCRATTLPLTNGTYHFRKINPEATLHVPAASIQAYKETAPWRDFKYIVPIETQDNDRPLMVKEGRTWNCQDIYPDDPHSVDPGYYEHDNAYFVIPRTYVFRGDTTINGNVYKKMYCNEKYRCAMRQDDQKVFTVFNGTQELLSYDFSMEKGMSIMRQTETLKIKDVDTVFVEGVARKRLMVYMDFADTEMLVDIWVEGIGSMGGPIATCLLFEATTPVHDMVSCIQDGECIFTKQDFYAPATKSDIKIAYRPFVEEGKVWKVGYGNRNPIQFVEYYYFEGDTIIDGRTCKQMMCQRYVTPDYSDYEVIMRYPLLRRSGVWYEEDKKVYEYNTTDKQFKLMYDFSVDDNATLQIHGQSYVVGPKLTEGLKGFKGVYRNVMWPSWDGEQIYDEGHHNTTWLEGVGSIEGPGYNVYLGKEYHGGAFLMACYAGDEVIYLNDEYEDGATPEVTGSRKNRFDFSHTVKTKPKSRTTRGAEPSLYGEYNDQQLGINLNPLYDAYLVSITDETGKTVYEKNINAGTIVGLNIDISAYAEGRYTVTVENSNESFTGQFDAQTVGMSDALRQNNNEKMMNDNIFDLQGRQLQGKPQRGLYIQNGKKVMVK